MSDIRSTGSVRYIVSLTLHLYREQRTPEVERFLKDYGLDLPPLGTPIEILLEKTDPRLSGLQAELKRITGSGPMTRYEPAFAPIELDRAELLHCLHDWPNTWFDWTARLNHALRRGEGPLIENADFGWTYQGSMFPCRRMLASSRLRSVFLEEGLEGWKADPMPHSRSGEVPLFYYIAPTGRLPAVADVTEIHRESWVGPKPERAPMMTVVQQGPLSYQRMDRSGFQDFNHTVEQFGSGLSMCHGVVISQRVRQLLQRNGIHANLEPVVTLPAT